MKITFSNEKKLKEKGLFEILSGDNLGKLYKCADQETYRNVIFTPISIGDTITMLNMNNGFIMKNVDLDDFDFIEVEGTLTITGEK